MSTETKRKPTAVLREFFSVPGKPVTLQEMTEFVKGTSKEERMEMAIEAARQLGVELDLG